MHTFKDHFTTFLLRLGSMTLAIVILTVLALASVIGTVLLQNQSQADYLQQFGPIWYWVFRSLGLFDMYHTWWFLSLLGLLMASLGVCLWRQIPRILKDMRSRKVTLSESAMKHMKHIQHWQADQLDSTAFIEHVKWQLNGWSFREDSYADTHYVRADKGRYNKLAYILVHAAILIILIGGWLGVQYGFRGDMAVPEGSKESEISYLKGTSTEYMKMPFEVQCNSFDIDFYPNGMPKEFRSNLTIIDQGKEVLTSDIIVNEPLYYKGVRIYQASFGDGGSNIHLKLFRMDGTSDVAEAQARVYTKYKDEKSGATLEITDFRPHNVENMAEADQPKDFKDLGASVDMIFRASGVKPVKVRSFIDPFVREGQNRGIFFQISLSGDTKEFQPFALGLDFSNEKEWLLFVAFVKHLAATEMKSPEDSKMAFKAALDEVFPDGKPDNFKDMAVRVMQAVQTIPRLPWPFLPVLDDYDQKYYTGLQVASDPGMNVVWIGSALLVIGLYIMFYVSHRKVWLVIKQHEKGYSISLAGMSNRNPLNFDREFHDILSNLDQYTRTFGKGDAS